MFTNASQTSSQSAPLLSELDRAYAAGFVDGEGCISVTARLKKYLTPTVQVSNTNQPILEWFLAVFGGNIDIRRDPRPTRKQCNTWRVAGDKARVFIREVYPYLRIKQPQAELALLWRPKTHGMRLTEGDFALAARIIKEMRALNLRGANHAA